MLVLIAAVLLFGHHATTQFSVSGPTAGQYIMGNGIQTSLLRLLGLCGMPLRLANTSPVPPVRSRWAFSSSTSHPDRGSGALARARLGLHELAAAVVPGSAHVQHAGLEVRVCPIGRIGFPGPQARERRHADEGALAGLGGGDDRSHLGLAERTACDAPLALARRVRAEALQQVALDQFALQREEQHGLEGPQRAVDRLARCALGTHPLEVVRRILPPDRPNFARPEIREQMLVQHRLVAGERARPPRPGNPLREEHLSDLGEGLPRRLRDVAAVAEPLLLAALEGFGVAARAAHR